ncbi:hypothetical protein JRO89_XS07G0172000 [Xanthoceras sorbifolium]|uniref:Small glutamine-rich tetratricopeptide repeat-containing protein n=1 Tax=Xanthoceras sorbifolium TaxID=99658 RepID=A0ABQ8HU84_9ROSI|nr:hypothetical protein JRO89_XS07G0172000 [Xanthoceras sorbifolium]
MTQLKTDSPLSRRIVFSFLDFLNSGPTLSFFSDMFIWNFEPAPGVDLEGLEVARECLKEVFKLDSPSPDAETKPAETKPDSLIDIFNSLEASGHGATAVGAPSSSSALNVADANFSEDSKSLVPFLPHSLFLTSFHVLLLNQDEAWMREPHSTGVSRDELFGQFISALEKIHYFKTMPDGNDDTSQVDKASHLFHDALNEMERSGSQAYNLKNLAETFKSQGNRAMQLKLYYDAIELYSFAIALCENIAVYYCNRAAAYTQIHKYTEAIGDCLKSMEIDPNYSKAYSRLGLAYYAQGNYRDAIEKGFNRALQLDPNNESVKENIWMAEQKLQEEQQQRGQYQSTSSSHNNQESDHSTAGFRSHGTPPSFTMPFNTGALPTDLASMLMNMAANMHQGQPSQNRQGEDSNIGGSDEPGIQMGGNFNLNFGEQMPEDLTGALRSMMEMFSGASSQGNSQNTDTMNGR